jgi:hypothetical protein
MRRCVPQAVINIPLYLKPENVDPGLLEKQSIATEEPQSKQEQLGGAFKYDQDG